MTLPEIHPLAANAEEQPKKLDCLEQACTPPPAKPSWQEVQAALRSAEATITDRYRALFHCKTEAPCMKDAVELIVEALSIQHNSCLLRHELCYVLGQLAEVGSSTSAPQEALGEADSSETAIICLRNVLADEREDEIVRHEAAEALAALEDANILEELDRLARDDASEPLRHTCELAAEGLRRKTAKAENALPICMCQTQYASRDPAEGKANATEADVPSASALLMDEAKPLYERYEALFTLRNVDGDAAVSALCEAMTRSSNAVLCHEVAFVLGQMENEAATQALCRCLADEAQHGMVRHEAAIALGSVGTDDAEAALRSYMRHSDQLVAESCEVALATSAYWKAWEAIEARIAAAAA